MTNPFLVRDLFHTLYAFCGGMKQPVQPEVAAAFNHFVRSFAWLCPSLVDAEEDWGRPICVAHDVCPFEPVATIHEFVDPHTFEGEQLAQKYLVAGVSKDEWGSRLWRLLHNSVPYFSPEELYSVLQACTVLLPCPQCRGHLSQMVSVYEPPQECCATQYLSDIHNIVNVRLGKPVIGRMSPMAQQISDYLNKAGH
jgi:hypothetical protein